MGDDTAAAVAWIDSFQTYSPAGPFERPELDQLRAELAADPGSAPDRPQE